MRAPGAQPDRQDHYAVLGVSDDATPRQITHAYRALVRALHPDTAIANHPSPARFTAVTTAYAVLHDQARRAAYDQTRPARPSTPPPAHVPAPAVPQQTHDTINVALPVREPLNATLFGPPAPGHACAPLLRVGPTHVRPLPLQKR